MSPPGLTIIEVLMKASKRQNFPHGLWVIATPIGNLADLSPRAIDALRAVDAICCEDTRHTRALCAAMNIEKSLLRLDAHSKDSTIAQYLERLTGGESLALVTDAGTPAISDPGAKLVKAVREAGIAVYPVPGACAWVALASIAGAEAGTHVFRGFFPRTEAERDAELEMAASRFPSALWVWYESPLRISSALQKVSSRFPNAALTVAKELTKLHERHFWGRAAEVMPQVQSHLAEQGERGEWCFSLEFNGEYRVASIGAGADMKTDSEAFSRAVRELKSAGVKASEAAKFLSQYFGVDRKEAYAIFLSETGKKNPRGA